MILYQLFLGEIRYTPLLMAAKASAKKEESENADEIIKFLIKSGANVSAVGNDG